MKRKYFYSILLIFIFSFTHVYSMEQSAKAQPESSHVVNMVRGMTALGMSLSGIAYLIEVYKQQVRPPAIILRGFRNPAFRWLCSFFSLATAQQLTVNVAHNPATQSFLLRRYASGIRTHPEEEQQEQSLQKTQSGKQ